jgi:hypothetical protein
MLDTSKERTKSEIHPAFLKDENMASVIGSALVENMSEEELKVLYLEKKKQLLLAEKERK